MNNFWQKFKKPILCLAPMEDITNRAYRELVAKYGKADVIWTEFTSVDGLMSEGRERLMPNLEFGEQEHPIVAQIFGANPENYYKTAKLLDKLGFDGIDINMGCPDKNINKQGSGAALIKHPKLAQQIIQATQAGAPQLPVSVKTRLGFNKIQTIEWTKNLLETSPAAIIMHLRTRREMSKVPAHWEEVDKIKKLAKNSPTLVIGNGDIFNLEDAELKCQKYNIDGVMIGRAAISNPWFFNPHIDKSNLSLKIKLQVMLEHARLYNKYFSDSKPFIALRKSMAAYLKGHPNVKELKMKIVQTKNLDEVERIVGEHQLKN